MGSDAGASLRVPAPGHLLALLLGIAGARRDGPRLRRACRGCAGRRGRGAEGGVAARPPRLRGPASRSGPAAPGAGPAVAPRPGGSRRGLPGLRGLPPGGRQPQAGREQERLLQLLLSGRPSVRPSVRPAAAPLCCGVLRTRAENPPNPPRCPLLPPRAVPSGGRSCAKFCGAAATFLA